MLICVHVASRLRIRNNLRGACRSLLSSLLKEDSRAVFQLLSNRSRRYKYRTVSAHRQCRLGKLIFYPRIASFQNVVRPTSQARQHRQQSSRQPFKQSARRFQGKLGWHGRDWSPWRRIKRSALRHEPRHWRSKQSVFCCDLLQDHR